jgi:hypothetical protein
LRSILSFSEIFSIVLNTNASSLGAEIENDDTVHLVIRKESEAAPSMPASTAAEAAPAAAVPPVVGVPNLNNLVSSVLSSMGVQGSNGMNIQMGMPLNVQVHTMPMNGAQGVQVHTIYLYLFV